MSSRPDSLESVVARVRRHLRRRAGAMAALAVALSLSVVLALAWILAGASGWEAGTPVPMLLSTAFGGAVLGTLAWVLLRLRSWLHEPNLTGEVERSASLPDGSVQAQIELGRSLPPGTSDALARSGEGRLLERLGPAVGDLAGRPGKESGRFLRLGLGALGGLVVLLAALFATTPERAWSAWTGLARPATYLHIEPLPPIVLRPGDAELPWGEPPAVEIEADGRDSVTVHWRVVGEVPETRTLPVGAGSASISLPALEAETTYWATDEFGSISLRHRLVPLEPLFLSDLLVEATFPEHTGLPPESFRGPPSQFEVPEGTRLHFSGEIGGAGDAVLLRAPEGPVLARFAVRGRSFSGDWAPPRSQRAEWATEGIEAGAVLPQPFDVELVPDQPPDVSLSLPEERSGLPLSRRLPLLIEASDDYGVAWVELEVVGRTAAVGAVDPMIDRVQTGARREVEIEPTLDLSGWELGPGDEILLRARAADNAPEPQVSESPYLRISMPGREAVRDAARERIQDAPGEVRSLAERAAREGSRLREMERRVGSGSGERAQDALRDAEELRSAVEQQAEMAAEIEELQETLGELREALEGGAEQDRALQDRIRELEELLEEALGPEAAERLRDLMERLQAGEELGQDPGQLLGELAEQQESLRDRLEESLERLRRGALEDLFRGVEDEARSLAEAQEQLAEQFQERALSDVPGESGEGADGLAAESAEQGDLAARAEALSERLEELGERLRAEGDSEAGDRAAEAGEEVSAARETMESAGEAGSAGDAQEAGSQGEQAAQELEDAAQKLEDARLDWQERWEDGIREALRRGAHDALSLARHQGEVRDAARASSPLGRSELQGEEAAIREGLRNLRADLNAATLPVPDLGRTLVEAVDGAMAHVDRTLSVLSGRSDGRVAPESAAEEAQAAMNHVALLALAALDQVGQSEQGMSLEELLEEMESLASQQEMLNEDASSLSEEMDSEGASAQLEDMAVAQESIAESLRELGERPGASEHGEDLDELARESSGISRELGDGRLDATTMERQERLLERLLAGGRTLGMEQPTEEREGTPASDVERSVMPALPEDLLRSERFAPPSPEDLEALSPGQRRMVLEYFDRLNRRGRDGG